MSIQYDGQKGYGLIEAINAAGHVIEVRDGFWWSSNDVAVQQIIDTYNGLAWGKADKLNTLTNSYVAQLGALTFGYLAFEVSSWSKQESEARNFIDGTNTSPTMLSVLAEQRNESVNTLCVKIIAKADAFNKATGLLLGKNHAMKKEIVECQSCEELKEIMV